MGKATRIEWTHHSFNPWWGCTRVSDGCTNCYAETFDKRVGGAHWGPGVPRRVFGAKHWAEPLQWNAEAAAAGERRRVFCASMADVFDADAPVGALDQLWALIRATPALDWLLLTKRHGRIARSLPADWGAGYPNVWLGVSVENQAAADQRIPVLLTTPAAVRFLSCEPLLGPVDLGGALHPSTIVRCAWLLKRGRKCPPTRCDTGLHWVIAGGESGPGARPMHPDWARSLRDQCQAAGAAFLFKQWGEYAPANFTVGNSFDRGGFSFGGLPIADRRIVQLLPSGQPAHTVADPFAPGALAGMELLARVGKHAAGRLLDGRTWDEYPTATGAVEVCAS